MGQPIKLRANDDEDLKVVSACLQDAIFPIGDMCFQPNERRFVAVANRFMWESAEGIETPPPVPGSEDSDLYPFQRVHTALRVENVTAVRSRNIDRHNQRLVLEMLSLEKVPAGLILHFAGGGCVLIESPGWRVLVEDIGDPWPTGCKPCHPIGAEERTAP
jgi:hypothetical protein